MRAPSSPEAAANTNKKEHPAKLLFDEMQIILEEQGPEEALRFMTQLIRYSISRTQAMVPGKELQAFGANCYSMFAAQIRNDEQMMALGNLNQSFAIKKMSEIITDVEKDELGILGIPVICAMVQIGVNIDIELKKQGSDLTTANRLSYFNHKIKPQLPIIS